MFNGESPKGFPSNLLKVARRKLRYLNAAAELGDLRAPHVNFNQFRRLLSEDPDTSTEDLFLTCSGWPLTPNDREYVVTGKSNAGVPRKSNADRRSGAILRLMVGLSQRSLHVIVILGVLRGSGGEINASVTARQPNCQDRRRATAPTWIFRY